MSYDAHPFEPAEDGRCAKCRMPLAHRLHSGALTRTRVVVVIDHPRDVPGEQVAKALFAVVRDDPQVQLVNLQVIE